MRVLVCGGRDFTDTNLMSETLYGLHEGDRGPITNITHGGARGADAMAEDWARHEHIGSTAIYADWKRYGRSAGPRRNALMLALEPALVVAFPGGRGTADMVRQAREAGVEVMEISP